MHKNQKTDTPDSCYSWVIAIACNLMYFIVLGMGRVTGVLFDEILTCYNVDRRLASLPFVVHPSIRCFGGPVVGFLIEVLGFRPVIMMGSILFALGTGGCFLTDDIVTICILWGVVSGIGDALATCALPQILYLYFEKHVATATGFASTGAPIAGFVLVPITVVLLEKFGLLGTFLMLGGIALHTLPFAIILKEPKSIVSQSQCQFFSCSSKTNDGSMKTDKDIKSSSSHYTINESKSEVILDLKSLYKTHLKENPYGIEGKYKIHNPHKTSNLPINSDLNENSIPIAQSGCRTNEKKPTRWFHALSILCNSAFLLIAVPRCFQQLNFIIIPTILVDFAKDKGIVGSMSAYILMFFAGGDLFGKVAFGWVTDRKYMTVAGFSSLCYAMTALSYAIMVWPSTFIVMSIATSFLGTCIGVISIMSFRLVSEYINPDKQIVAMTSGEILAGPAGLLVTSLIGYFRDDLGSYNLLMYIMSIALLASSGMLLLLPRIANSKISR